MSCAKLFVMVDKFGTIFGQEEGDFAKSEAAAERIHKRIQSGKLKSVVVTGKQSD